MLISVLMRCNADLRLAFLLFFFLPFLYTFCSPCFWNVADKGGDSGPGGSGTLRVGCGELKGAFMGRELHRILYFNLPLDPTDRLFLELFSTRENELHPSQIRAAEGNPWIGMRQKINDSDVRRAEHGAQSQSLRSREESRRSGLVTAEAV